MVTFRYENQQSGTESSAPCCLAHKSRCNGPYDVCLKQSIQLIEMNLSLATHSRTECESLQRERVHCFPSTSKRIFFFSLSNQKLSKRRRPSETLRAKPFGIFSRKAIKKCVGARRSFKLCFHVRRSTFSAAVAVAAASMTMCGTHVALDDLLSTIYANKFLLCSYLIFT